MHVFNVFLSFCPIMLSLPLKSYWNPASQQVPHLLTFIFCLFVFLLACFETYWVQFELLIWTWVEAYLLEQRQLTRTYNTESNDYSSPGNSRWGRSGLPTACHRGKGVVNSSPIHDGFLTGPILFKSCADHSCCQFMSSTAIPYPRTPFRSSPPQPPALQIFLLLLWHPLSFAGVIEMHCLKLSTQQSLILSPSQH